MDRASALSDPPEAFGAVHPADCVQEPIHIPGSIQPHGALLTLDTRDLRIVHAGGDTVKLLGAPVTALLGAPAADIFSPGEQARLWELLGSSRPVVRPVHAFSLRRRNAATTDVIAHVSDGLLVLEFEPWHVPPLEDAMAMVQGMIRHVQQSSSLQALYDAIATGIRAAIGFDRVLIYRFSPDGSGAVVAEAGVPGIDTFLGLNFPGSDIPQQARALYLTNGIRYIPDARYQPAPILPPLNPFTGQPLDLTNSVLRSVSPKHRHYLAGMGVIGSMSVSLILRGRLWGLIICHHRKPRYLSHRLREVCELFAEMTSAQLEMKLIESQLAGELRLRGVHEQLVYRMGRERELADGLIGGRPNLLDVVPASGAGLWVNGQFASIGATPNLEQIEALVDWLNIREQDGIFATGCLPAIYPPAGRYAEVASGLIALSVSKTPRDYVLWFRGEMSKAATGTPPRIPRPDTGPNVEPLASGNRFAIGQDAIWWDSIRLHASPWTESELDAAHRLRVSLLEVVLRRTDRAAREQATASRHQESLSQETALRLSEWRTLAEALKLETERRAMLEAELSAVLRRTVTDQEAERVRLARELHDTLGQSLTLLQLGLESIGDPAIGGAAFQARLAGLRETAAGFGRELNRLAWEIRPTALDDLGIQRGVRDLVETWSERVDIEFDLHLTLGDERLPPDVETTLYRVLQEALTNVVRHAGASRLGVVLGLSDHVVTMIVEDNGNGFVNTAAGLELAPAKRLGLLGIRERLTLVNGSLEIESASGRGTTLFIRIPVP